MSAIQAVPLQIACSNCNHILLDAHLDIETASPIERTWTLVDYLNVTCSHCNSVLHDAFDDFSRVLEGLEFDDDDHDEDTS